MKALLFTNLFPSQREPTRAVFSLQRFRALAAHCEVRLVAPMPAWSRLRAPKDLLRVPGETHAGIEATYPAYWSIPGVASLHGAGMYASVRGHVERIRAEFPFEVILAAWAYPDAAAAARLAKAVGCPLVTMVLGSDINELARRPELKEQIREALLASHRVVAVSDALRREVEALGIPPEQVIVQRNGVDGERFRVRDRGEARDRLGLPRDRRIICYVGNFKPEKGVEHLVSAMGQPPLSGVAGSLLTLVGGGPLEEELRRRVAAMGAEDRVHFAGRRPHDEVPDWIAAADVLCLPSLREGCPNVVLEALASGRPVVASRVGGVPELVPEGAGILVPPADPSSLAGALSEALSRPWDAETLRGTVDCLSWEQYGLTLRDALRSAIEAHRAGRREGALAGAC